MTIARGILKGRVVAGALVVLSPTLFVLDAQAAVQPERLTTTVSQSTQSSTVTSGQTVRSASAGSVSDAVEFASVGGSGTSCSLAAPCSVQGAVDQVVPGGTVSLLSGQYPLLSLRDSSAHLTNAQANAVLTPDAGAAVTLAGIDNYVAHLTIRNVHVVSGTVFLRPGADYSTIDGADVDGQSQPLRFGTAAVILAANHTGLVDSHVHDFEDADLVNLGASGRPVQDVTVNGNTLNDALTGPLGVHVDCLQAAGQATHLVITNNKLFGCANSEMIIKADLGPIADVLIANNNLQGCPPNSTSCNGYFVLYIRINRMSGYSLTNIKVMHNTLNGSISVDPAPSRVLTGNIISTFSPGQETCGKWLQYNLISNTGCDSTLPATNKIGTPIYVDEAGHDLHLQPGSAGAGIGGPASPTTDIDNHPRVNPITAGAAQLP